METLDLILNESNSITFGVDIQGAATTNISARFIIESVGMNIEVIGTYDKGEVTFDLPILSNILKPTIYAAKLELILEKERLFTPLELQVKFIQPVVVEAAIIRSPMVHENQQAIQTSVENRGISVTAAVRREIRKTESELIAENLDVFSGCKNINSVCFQYSKLVLLRENFIPLDGKEVLLKIDEVCVEKFGRTFGEYTKSMVK